MTTIWIPKKELIVSSQVHTGVQGFFKLEATKPNGRKRLLADWFPNLITDGGLNQMGISSYLQACHVGTNNAAPSVLDTNLGGFLAGSTTVQDSDEGAQSSAPWYGWKRKTYRFGTGIATGNLSEVGIATQITPAGVLFSRALVLDEFQVPTTVTVLADETLDVTYECRLYPPSIDVTGNITVTGSGSHDYVGRAHLVNEAASWGAQIGTKVSHTNLYGTNHSSVYDGALGTLTTWPAGGGANGPTPVDSPYQNDTLTLDGTYTFVLNVGNTPLNIIRSVVTMTVLGRFQYELTPPIAKDNTKTLVLVHRLTWGRYVP